MVKLRQQSSHRISITETGHNLNNGYILIFKQNITIVALLYIPFLAIPLWPLRASGMA